MDANAIIHRFGESILAVDRTQGEDVLTVHRDVIIPLCRFLANEDAFGFNFLTDLFGVDRYPQSPRFQVVYHLYSLKHGRRLRIKVPLDEADPVVDSVTAVWAGADWCERECYDMLGILFSGHPGLERILMPTDFSGHPLRKDYPLEGVPEP